MHLNLNWTASPQWRSHTDLQHPESRFNPAAILRNSWKVCLLAGMVSFLPAGVAHAQTGWKLVWGEEFNGPPGAPPAASSWRFEQGAGRYVGGNQEAETYCAASSATAPCDPKRPNAYLDGEGHLVIEAIRTDQTLPIEGKNFSSPVYTSARIDSLKSFRYGRMEANIRVPIGQGVWPAFWGLGVHDGSMNWPQIGEADIMEVWNPQPGTTKIDPYLNHASVHGPMEPGAKNGYTDVTGTYSFPAPMPQAFHQFAVEWSPGELDFYCDGILYSRQSVGNLSDKKVWEMDNAPFYLLLNLAMGGEFFGYPDSTTPQTVKMLVDYVRVYQRDEDLLPRGWGNADIGGPPVAGSTSHANGQWTIAGAGTGFDDHSDQFQFAYSALGGDGEISAHVAGASGKARAANAGVMIRNGRGSAAMYAMMFAAADGTIHFRTRGHEDDAPKDIAYHGKASWLKVGRSSDLFTGYASTDGKSWTRVGQDSVPMQRNLLAGLVATSRTNAELHTTQFDSVNVTSTEAAWDGAPVEIPGVVQAEEFDTGGAGHAYDATWKHQGDSSFRPQEGPAIRQIKTHGEPDVVPGGYYLFDLPAKASVNYAVHIAKEGSYTFRARVSSQGTGGVIHFNLDQKPVTKAMQIPDTGGSEKWTVLYFGPTQLPAGEHVISLVTEAGGQEWKVGNVDYFSVLPW